MAKHSLGRPPEGAQDVLALLSSGKWIKDDGKKHPAFVYRKFYERTGGKGGKGGPICYAIGDDCNCTFSRTCPMDRAMRKCCSLYGVANGERW